MAKREPVEPPPGDKRYVRREPKESLTQAAPLLDLLDREERLMEQFRFMDEASYRRRSEIEEELSEIRRALVRLGFARSK
jgi:hypothetical protein